MHWFKQKKNLAIVGGFNVKKSTPLVAVLLIHNNTCPTPIITTVTSKHEMWQPLTL